MRYQMKQKVFALGNDFIVKDDAGNDVFFVDGKALSMGDKLSIQDMAGNEVAYIAQKLLSFKKRYSLFRNGDLFAEVTKEFTFFRDKYLVDLPGPNDYEVQGDFWDHEYCFIHNGREVAWVSKAFFSWSDTYGIDIEDGEDDVAILATAVVIDMVNQDDAQRR